MKSRVLLRSILFTLVVLFSAGIASANLGQVKIYKSAFPDAEKPKCTTCHVDKMPKKDDGMHEWNDYGKKVRAVKETPDEDTYKSVGPNTEAE